MDFNLSPDQESFRQTLRDFVDREIRPHAAEMEHSGAYPTDIVESMKAMDLFGINVPEEYGGLGLDQVSLAIVFEEIARGWMGVAGILGSHSVSCRLIAQSGTEEQKSQLLPLLATGERRTGFAVTEPGAGSDLQGISTVAVRDGDHYVVTGTKTWITNARHADPLPVLVKTDPTAEPRHRGMSFLLVDPQLPGFEVQRDLGKLGYKGPESCEVTLDHVRVPVESLLGGVEGLGLKQALSALESGRINVAARAVGVSEASLAAALRYSTEREAFGHPIADFQAIQLALADLATETHAARLLTWWAADQLDKNTRADTQTGMAKLFASEVALRSSLAAMRVHGGYGYSTEFEVERYYRDAPLMAIGEGTSDILRTVIAKGILARGTDW
ncbi:acyl-CoA dehydrogenase family protein [Nocardioides agariphilus]|uniref:Acyl-CoA dehydrogenase family protein n=1 Tax=Nocardioides agariphilus TaxID=433664 RepID=A0A930YF77_9ACTN|nr:acyl-CoA dehydrogenase family protein [Nocardioides agariphilus]MBF4766211.1 acyl-CoA dehydrogenase family protein [Nocardioides agariphilus]